MKREKTANILFAAAFLGFLVLMAAVFFVLPRNDVSFFENRRLAERPELTKESVLSGAYFSGMEDWLKDRAAGRSTLLRLDTRYRLLRNCTLLRCPVVNETVVLENVLLPFNPYETVNPDALTAGAQALAANLDSVRAATEACGGQYLFVMVPCQYVSYESEYPSFLNNRAEVTVISRTALLDALAQTDVEVLDMGETLLQPEVRDRAASRVDNHYTLYGAYRTYVEIMDRINAGRGTPLTVLDGTNSTVTELPSRYLGSRSRKLLNQSGITEHLEILTPNEAVPFRRWNGGTESAPTVYRLPASEWELADYGLYMGGDMPETVIDTDREDLPTVLVYGDSFTNAVECLLWYGFGEMRSLDLRYYTDMSLGAYIETYRPDYVICIRDYEQLASTDYNGRPAF